MSTAWDHQQQRAAKRANKPPSHVVAVPTPDPLDTYTDAGICRLIPCFTASTTINEDEAQRRYDAEREARLQALAAIVNTTAPS